MDLSTYKPKNITEELILLHTKNIDTVLNTKTLEFKFEKSREFFSFDIPLQLDDGE